jgi:hypothetical protein
MDDRTINESTQLLALLRKSQSFAENLLRENEQLRINLAALEARCRGAEEERDRMRSRFADIDAESSHTVQHYQEMEEELNTLANLHVASWQIHSTLELKRIIDAAIEICINLVGAQAVTLYIHDEERRALVPLEAHGVALGGPIPVGEGPIGRAVASREVVVGDGGGGPVAVLPMIGPSLVVGVIAIHSLLPQKAALTDLDQQLFRLLSEQAATAFYSAFLAGVASRPMTEVEVRKCVGA